MHTEVIGTIILNLLRGFDLRVAWKPVPLIWSAQRLVALLALREQALGARVWPAFCGLRRPMRAPMLICVLHCGVYNELAEVSLSPPLSGFV